MKFFKLKLITFLIFTTSFTAEEGKWAFVDTISNDNPNYSMKVSRRFVILESEDQPYGWVFGRVWPRIRGGAFISVGEEIIIPPNGSMDFETTEVPQMATRGHSNEKRIRLEGICEKTETDNKTEDDLELKAGYPLILEPLRGLGFAWLKNPLNGSRSVSFGLRTEGDGVLAIGSEIGPDYLFKIILGQNESKIITKEEELKEKAVTKNNEFLIKYGDTIRLKNIETGKILEFDFKSKKVIAGDPENISENNEFILTPKPIPPGDQILDENFVQNGSTISIFNNGNLSGRFGGATSIEPKRLAWEKFIVEKIDTTDSNLKNGDQIRLLSAHDQAYLVLNEKNNLAEIRWPWQNGYNVWKIELVRPPKKMFYKPKYPTIKKEDNPQAVATSGFNGMYWVSIIGNNVFVGYGYEPGKKFFLSRKLPEKFIGKMNFIGFSSNNKTANYANILQGDPIKFLLPPENYKTRIISSISFLPNKNEWLRNTFRSSNKGSVSFNAKTKSGISVKLGSNPDNSDSKYEVEIGANNNNNIYIYKYIDNEKILKAQSYLKKSVIPSDDKFYKYTVSIDDGIITVFRNKDLLLIWQDPNPFHQYKYISLGSLNDPIEYKNIKISPSAKIDLKSAERAYRESLRHYKENEFVLLKLVAPYVYYLQHSKHNLQISDPLYKKETWKLVGMEKMGEHNFRITISKSGIPTIEYTQEPKGHIVEQILNIGANVLGSTGEALSQIPNPKVAAAGIVTKVGADIISGVTKAAFAPTKGIYTQQARIAGMEKHEDEDIAIKTKEIKELLNKFDQLNITTDAGFKDGININQMIIDKIVSPDNAPADIKNRILRNFRDLYDETIRYQMTKDNATKYNNFIKLLIKAHDNIFFLNPRIKKDSEEKEELYRNINQLSSDLFNGLKNKILNTIKFPPCHGEYIWYTETLPQLDKGTLFFQASGRKDIIIGFDSEKSKIKLLGQPKELYQVIIGGWKNTITAICSDSDARTIEAFTTNKENPNAMAPFVGFRTYWASLNEGMIKFGTIQDGQLKQILEWQDPYPRPNIQYIGFSSWDANIELKNVIVTKPIEELNEQEKQEIFNSLGEPRTPVQTMVTQPIVQPVVTETKRERLPRRIQRKRARRKR